MIIGWNIDKSRPICPQICEQLCVEIARGVIPAGGRLFSVREVAVRMGVNPNTVQKAFCQLESEGVIYSVRGSGWYVSENTESASTALKRIIKHKTDTFFSELKNLGLKSDEIKKIVEEWENEGITKM